MGMVGCLGDIVFTVSDRTIETINKCLLGLARPATHPPRGTHTPSQSSFSGLHP